MIESNLKDRPVFSFYFLCNVCNIEFYYFHEFYQINLQVFIVRHYLLKPFFFPENEAKLLSHSPHLCNFSFDYMQEVACRQPIGPSARLPRPSLLSLPPLSLIFSALGISVMARTNLPPLSSVVLFRRSSASRRAPAPKAALRTDRVPPPWRRR